MMKAGYLVLFLAAAGAAPAEAQMTWTDKGFVNVTVGVQGGSRTFETDTTYELYGEQGRLQTSQDAGGGALFDVTAGYKVWRNLAVGLGWSRSGSDSNVAIAAQVPDPIFFDRLRPLTATADGMDHSENAIHFHGTWMMPVTDKVDVGFSFGPTIFNVSQEFPSAITVNEPGPSLGSTTIAKADDSAVGFNLGVDVTYLVTPRFGAGVLLRYTYGSVSFDEAPGTDLTVGGLQFGVGLRARF